jgi:hypothetical protein
MVDQFGVEQAECQRRQYRTYDEDNSIANGFQEGGISRQQVDVIVQSHESTAVRPVEIPALKAVPDG